ncbi:hypothetical protein SKAU_G00134530 [Synaphobranchus kaupii]|uniref:Uncharacterized protein n=1 Tax=Synaphobranchus kaupii TaxID=118154 RepID=A0A9Q1J1J2_SYNKA|nr:hypothetical protein SKAU_G00134530 [Synaphobranchus kaupii]
MGLVGALSVTLCYGSKTLPTITFQVSRHSAKLMGLDLFPSLGFTLLDNAPPPAISKIKPTIFCGISGVVIYLANIVVHGLMPAPHDKHLRRVLNTLARHNVN